MALPSDSVRSVDYSVATPASDPVQKIAALVSYRSTHTTVPPLSSAITTISLANGAILTKDTLPGPAQVTAAECTPTCPLGRLCHGNARRGPAVASHRERRQTEHDYVRG